MFDVQIAIFDKNMRFERLGAILLCFRLICPS